MYDLVLINYIEAPASKQSIGGDFTLLFLNLTKM